MSNTIHSQPDCDGIEAPLGEQFRFEELIAEVSSDFVSASDDLETITKRALSRVGGFMAVDRVSLCGFDIEQSALNREHEWSAGKIDASSNGSGRETRLSNPWLFHRLCAGELVAISRVQDLPEAAALERAELQGLGVQSVVWMPLQFGGRIVGVLRLDSVRAPQTWSEQQIARLKLLGNIIANARERVRSERALRATREFAQAVTAASPHICFVFDIDLQRTLYVNSNIEYQLGYSPAEVFQMGDQLVPQIMHPDDKSRFSDNLSVWQTATDDQTMEFKYRIRRRDGQWRWSQAWVKVFHRAADGHVDQVIGWSEDFTDRQHAEEDLQRHRDELAHVDRINTMGEMAAGIAHEISQPLYSITNFVNAAKNVLEQRNDADLKEVATWLQRASNAAGNAAEIIQRLRSFARGQQHERHIELVKSLIKEALTFMEFDVRRREIRVVLDDQSGNATVLVDRIQILQVLVNLLQNACEAMASRDPADRVVTVNVFCDEKRVLFRVKDHGIGLPDNQYDIFEPFITTKPNGLGLGLAISKTIVEKHQGELTAERNPDVGATFQVVLPLNEEKSQYE